MHIRRIIGLFDFCLLARVSGNYGSGSSILNSYFHDAPEFADWTKQQMSVH